MIRPARLAGLVVVVIAAACAGADPAPDTLPAAPTLAPPGFTNGAGSPPPPPLDDERVLSGEILYQQHCAECHGADLSGEPDWMIPNDDGTYKPPPQDSTGHTWHHPDGLLLEIVRDGSAIPIAVMPTFGDVLTDDQIGDVLQFIKSHWGDQERAFQWEITWQAEQGG